MNSINDILESNILDGKNVVIFGAALTGKTACDDLQANGIEVAQFIDENPDKQGKKYFGVSVSKQLDMTLKENAIVILCCHPLAALSKEEILRVGLLERIGVDEAQLVILDREKGTLDAVKACFETNGIDLSRQYLDLPGVRIPNYLKMDENIKISFLQECGDILLPKLFQEYSAVMEGPYEEGDFCINQQGGEVIFDCGANIGLFSAMAAANPANRVYAFEPVPKTLDVLKKVQEIYANITIVPIALADYSGMVRMSDSEDLGTNKIVQSSEIKGIDVTVKTIDEFVEENRIAHVDFIKADIEGAERIMLRGAKQVLKRFAPKLSICTYHLDDDPEVLENIIKKANPQYHVIQKRHKLFAYV